MTELTRVYACTAESVDFLKNEIHRKEVHVVLPFARDYDAAGKHQIGKFVPYFDSSFTPDKIQEIKNTWKSTVKFFLSIGGRNKKYPFYIPPGKHKHDEWVKNAIQSLKDIVNNYRLDGIDVYYEHVKSLDEFSSAIQEVLLELKSGSEKVIINASLSVSAPLDRLYYDLYKGKVDFDHVVYQSYSVTTPISTDELVNIFETLTREYPPNKIVAGHSILTSDWIKVPLLIFFGAIPMLPAIGIVSISEWIVTDYECCPEA